MFLYVFVLLLYVYSGTLHAQDNNGLTLKKVVIDPGHGGRDPGASGARSKEKDIVLDISLRVGKMISEKYPDVEVIYTRKTDIFIELDKRGDIANKAHADLFISIHANSVKPGNRCPSGAETFVMGDSRSAANMEVAMLENSVILLEDDYSTRYEKFDPNKVESYITFSLMQNAHLNQSLDFAAELQTQFKSSAKRTDRGVKQANILVLWKTAMPSVLVELGFICNSEEERFMISAAGKEAFASSIFKAFSSYKAKIEDRSSFRQTDQTANPKKVEFCIQIATSSRLLDTNPNNFKKLTGVERIKITENSFKYIVGRTTNYATAQETLKKVRADYNDAFVVSMVDGKILSAAEGLKLITE